MKKIFLILLLITIPQFAWADSFFDQFIDPKDGAIDVSEWLGGRTGFLPVPLLITEPAVGVGAGAALVFFHDSGEEKQDNKEPSEEKEFGRPPSVSVVAGAYTESDSWFLGGGHMGSWKKDTIRYQGIIGMADLNLKFYGIGEDSNVDDSGLEFNIEGQFLLQELKFRIKDSNFFLGGRYTLLNSETRFDLPGNILEVPQQQLDSKSAGLGIIANFDNRDNTITPNTGHNAKLEYMDYNETWGGGF